MQMVDLDKEPEKLNLTQENSQKYTDLSSDSEDTGVGGKISGIFGSVISQFKKNAKIIAVLCILLALGAAYFLMQPRTGNLTIEVTQMDSPGEAIVGASVSVTMADGKSAIPQEILTDEIGLIKLYNVPAEVPLAIRVTPPDTNVNSFKKTVTLENGGSVTVEAALEKRNSLSFDQNSYEFIMAPGCFQKLLVDVSNLGEGAFDTDLIPDEKIKKFVERHDVATIPTGGKAILIAKLQMPSDAEAETKGSMRLKYTSNRKIDITLKKSDKKPKLDVSFEKTEAKDFKSVEAELPAIKKSQVKIRNTGGSGSPSLSEIKISIIGDFASWAALDLATIDEINANGGIGPGQEVLFGLTITVPAGTVKGPYSGQMIVSTNCDSKPIPLSARIE
jgi:hypothetical protein